MLREPEFAEMLEKRPKGNTAAGREAEDASNHRSSSDELSEPEQNIGSSNANQSSAGTERDFGEFADAKEDDGPEEPIFEQRNRPTASARKSKAQRTK